MATTVNTSRSNNLRLIYPDTVTHEQAAAILAALDKHGRAAEATLERELQKILHSVGVRSSDVGSFTIKSARERSEQRTKCACGKWANQVHDCPLMFGER